MAVRYTNFSLFFDLECGFLFKQYDENLKPDKVTVCPKTKKPIRKLIGFKRLWAMRFDIKRRTAGGSQVNEI